MGRLEALEVFRAVADMKGFSPAARQLGVSKSFVSKAVAS